MFDRAIVHMDLDAFFVSVECLRNRALKGKPLIIGGSSARGVVASCSYEARHFGVHSAMPVKMALRLCPSAIVLRGDMEAYSNYSALVTDVVAAHAPLFEKTSIDEFYLDLTGMDKHFGCYKWSLELRQCIMRETGLPISFGLSVNKTVSKVGTGEAKPNGTLEIAPGREKGFLAPLPVGKIPGVGRETQMQLSFMGVRTVSVLSEMPVKLLEREFGKSGRQLWLKSNGIDTTPVEPWNDQKSMSAERTLTEDTLDLVFIRRLLGGLVEKLAWQLRQEAKLASCITVKIRYADFNTFSRQKRIAYTANDKSLLHAAQELFEQLYQRRQLIRLVGIRLSGLVRGHYQMSLFDDTAEEVELLQAMDRLRNRYGSKSVGRAAHLLNK